MTKAELHALLGPIHTSLLEALNDVNCLLNAAAYDEDYKVEAKNFDRDALARAEAYASLAAAVLNNLLYGGESE